MWQPLINSNTQPSIIVNFGSYSTSHKCTFNVRRQLLCDAPPTQFEISKNFFCGIEQICKIGLHCEIQYLRNFLQSWYVYKQGCTNYVHHIDKPLYS